jgi:phosphatidylinositol-3,4,5-trisphosphate 3-phosphatase/dual-specificity protein phosphatase PTEN
LARDKKNIAAVHCKAGKGRTGLMICCYLIWSGVINTANDALDYYALMRTFNEKGVTIPSQIRYVRYFELAVRTSLSTTKYLNNVPELKLTKVRVSPIPNLGVFGGCTPWVLINCRQGEYKSKYTHELITYRTEEVFEIPLSQECRVRGDFKLTFFTKGMLNKSEKFMHLWLNTYFLPEDATVLCAR